jgi:Putative transmembrane protein (PGPGW)
MTGTERPAAATSPWRVARKVVVAVIGATVLALGVALIVLPGPAVVVIPLGLAILGTEFLWARPLLQRLRDSANWALRRPSTEKHDA